MRSKGEVRRRWKMEMRKLLLQKEKKRGEELHKGEGN